MAAPTDGEAVDLEIYEALQRGDQEAAFRRLVRQHGKIVHTVSYRLLKDSARAEDVMQETFMKAYETIDTLHDPKRLGSWLKSIAWNKSIDILRAEKRADAHRTALDQQAEGDDTAPAPEALSALTSDEDRRALQDCLDALPPEKRAAIVGRFFADLEYRELAAVTGEKTDTLRIRVGRAMPELRECLERKGVTP
ncbi:MAG TPA: RNA polymerase sigma factor [Kofleriaceae bacterium]|nr:RNA polymerase sigma factor [Kofleriaceae bacterium]